MKSTIFSLLAAMFLVMGVFNYAVMAEDACSPTFLINARHTTEHNYAQSKADVTVCAKNNKGNAKDILADTHRVDTKHSLVKIAKKSTDVVSN